MLLCLLMRDVNRPNQDDPSVIGEATLTVDLIFQENLDGPDATLPPHFYTVVYPCSQTYLYFSVLSLARKPIGSDFHGRRSSKASAENACANPTVGGTFNALKRRRRPDAGNSTKGQLLVP